MHSAEMVGKGSSFKGLDSSRREGEKGRSRGKLRVVWLDVKRVPFRKQKGSPAPKIK